MFIYVTASIMQQYMYVLNVGFEGVRVVKKNSRHVKVAEKNQEEKVEAVTEHNEGNIPN